MSKKNRPKSLNQLEIWETNRRKFIKSVGVFAIYTQILRFQSCQTKTQKVYVANDYLNALQVEIIQKVQNVLFPDDGNGPSAYDINAYGHFIWVISDQRKRTKEVTYLINGIDWTNETAIEEFNKPFNELSDHEVENLIEFISNENWGKDWLSVVLTLIFEALALDSIYNINTNEVGWKWLEHTQGTPRPHKEITYDKIFKTIGKE
jgi:gluconate 2-dehydrogenase gamma chain